MYVSVWCVSFTFLHGQDMLDVCLYQAVLASRSYCCLRFCLLEAMMDKLVSHLEAVEKLLTSTTKNPAAHKVASAAQAAALKTMLGCSKLDLVELAQVSAKIATMAWQDTQLEELMNFVAEISAASLSSEGGAAAASAASVLRPLLVA